jgi:hypothetical protein
MGLVDWVRPDPKCNHGRVRGTCLKCTGAVPAGGIPTGNFKGKPGGRLVAKKKPVKK